MCNISNAVILHEMNEQCRDKSIETVQFTLHNWKMRAHTRPLSKDDKSPNVHVHI